MSVTERLNAGWNNGNTTVGLVADTTIDIDRVNPGVQAVGDIILVLAAWKDFSITATVAGYTEITEFADGSVATGNGTGSMKVGAWYKVATAAPEADPTVDFSSTTNLLGAATVSAFSKSLTTWTTPAFVTAAKSSSAGPQTVNASSTVTVPSGGAVVCMVAISDDSLTFSRPTTAISDSGSAITWNGNYAEYPATHSQTTTGNDMSVDAGYRKVTTGAAGVTLQTTITALTAAETGAVLWIVLGDESTATPVTGTGAGTETAQTASGTAAETMSGTGGGSGTASTATGSGTSLQTFTGTGAGTQAAATALGSGTETITGTGAGSQAIATAAGTGSALLAVTGSGAGAGAAATSSGTGDVTVLGEITGTGAGEQAAATATGDGLLVYAGGGVQVPQSGYGEGTVEEIPVEPPIVPGASIYFPRLAVIRGSGSGVQVRQSAHGTGTVNDDDLVVMAA